MTQNKRNTNFEEVILRLSKLIKGGDRTTARKSMDRIAKLGKIDERAVEIIRLEKEHTKDK